MVEMERELQQLNEFHEQLAALEPAAQASLLRNGFLPETAAVLAEAGIRCLPLIESGNADITDGAADRLEAILFKLRLAPDAGGVRKTLNELEAVLQKRRRQDTSDLRFGLAFFAGLGLAVAALAIIVLYILLR